MSPIVYLVTHGKYNSNFQPQTRTLMNHLYVQRDLKKIHDSGFVVYECLCGD